MVDTYECSCGGFISIGSLEPQFYGLLFEALKLSDDPAFKDQLVSKQWPAQKQGLTEIFMTKTRDDWCNSMEGSNICSAPVLNPVEASKHPHMKAPNIYSQARGEIEANSAPLFVHSKNSKPNDSSTVSFQNVVNSWK